ncbi:MAG: hypothetical protein F6K36_12220 [Symploca sp. SIO3C6]|uniref:Uncharacterized protein n=1 Tax=Symploca sp. SIO1C4 TaxID=2607765 RepID=A0A6B3NLG3_9CYAN|nr:hypothetical protein [Symploca sp. SIO3C6]NER31775.1 hypothetical protein [Symploca sp. SIO1C4]NET06448.1 hypothetical protein [Symploca sp. SIO2B6]NET51963.1 hypothetical protein [Merismopedia sp. SIO2A8]
MNFLNCRKFRFAATVTTATAALSLGTISPAVAIPPYTQVSEAAAECVNNTNSFFGVTDIIRSASSPTTGAVTLKIFGGGEAVLTYAYDLGTKTLNFDLVRNTSIFASEAAIWSGFDSTVNTCKAINPL